jgi:hypothetical protein
MASPRVPDFDRLPKVEGMPQGCAWGVFDKGGKKDVMGTLNLLTPDVVKAAVAEVKEGVSVSLKYAPLEHAYYPLVNSISSWPIGAIKTPGFGRKGLVHKVIAFEGGALACKGFDDEVRSEGNNMTNAG